MKSTLVELAKELQDVKDRIGSKEKQSADILKELDSDKARQVELQSAITAEFGNGNPSNNGHVAGSATKGKKGGKRGPRTEGGKTTKEHILEVIRRKREGAELVPIVTAMKQRKDNGEWHTNAEQITTVVSQALNSLKKEKMVTMEKNPETKKNVYKVTAQAA